MMKYKKIKDVLWKKKNLVRLFLSLWVFLCG